MFGLELFRARPTVKEKEEKNEIVSQEQGFEIKGIEFKKRADDLSVSIQNMIAQFESVRRLPVGSDEQKKEAEYIRALKVKDLREKIGWSLGEVGVLLRATEGKNLSVYSGRVDELNLYKQRIEKLMEDMRGIILPEEYIDLAA